jgi:hypothetical protein
MTKRWNSWKVGTIDLNRPGNWGRRVSWIQFWKAQVVTALDTLLLQILNASKFSGRGAGRSIKCFQSKGPLRIWKLTMHAPGC